MGFPGGSVIKNLQCGRPGFKRSPWGGHGSPGESQGQRSLGGCRPRGRQESDSTERLSTWGGYQPITEGNWDPGSIKGQPKFALALKRPIQDWHLVCLTSGSLLLTARVLRANLYDISMLPFIWADILYEDKRECLLGAQQVCSRTHDVDSGLFQHSPAASLRLSYSFLSSIHLRHLLFFIIIIF